MFEDYYSCHISFLEKPSIHRFKENPNGFSCHSKLYAKNSLTQYFLRLNLFVFLFVTPSGLFYKIEWRTFFSLEKFFFLGQWSRTFGHLYSVWELLPGSASFPGHLNNLHFLKCFFLIEKFLFLDMEIFWCSTLITDDLMFYLGQQSHKVSKGKCYQCNLNLFLIMTLTFLMYALSSEAFYQVGNHFQTVSSYV